MAISMLVCGAEPWYGWLRGFVCYCSWHTGVQGRSPVWVAVSLASTVVLVCRGWSLNPLWDCFNATCLLPGVGAPLRRLAGSCGEWDITFEAYWVPGGRVLLWRSVGAA